MRFKHRLRRLEITAGTRSVGRCPECGVVLVGPDKGRYLHGTHVPMRLVFAGWESDDDPPTSCSTCGARQVLDLRFDDAPVALEAAGDAESP